MIIGEQEGTSNHFVNWEDSDNTHPTILSPPTLHQDGYILIEKEQWGLRGDTRTY